MKKVYNNYMNEKGQVVLILILVMTVALAIGLSVIQRSLSDVATSTKVEQSSRAFSAAEAGLEQAIRLDDSVFGFDLDESSRVEGVTKNNVPDTAQALEYLPIGKEEIAQVWLADPTSLTFPSCDVGKICYPNSTLGIYYGNYPTTTDIPAIEITVIYQDTSNLYKAQKYYYDSQARGNDFTAPTCPSDLIRTSLSPTVDKRFMCFASINTASIPNISKLILLRARLLYSSSSHSFAVKPATGLSLPIQARLFTSTGSSGETQRIVQILRLDRVVPFYFDYAIFSVGKIEK